MSHVYFSFRGLVTPLSTMAGKQGMMPLEVEDRGNDMKLQASANGAYDPVKVGEVDDDGRFPKRSGRQQRPSAAQHLHAYEPV